MSIANPSVDTVSELEKLEIGDYVKHGRKFCVITDIFSMDGNVPMYDIRYHNGFKLTNDYATRDRLEKITEELFWKNNKGNTSFYEVISNLKKEKEAIKKYHSKSEVLKRFLDRLTPEKIEIISKRIQKENPVDWENYEAESKHKNIKVYWDKIYID